MKGFRVMALTDTGKEALKAQLSDWKRQPLHARLLQKQLFRLSSTDEELRMEVKDRRVGALMQSDDIRTKVVQGFREHGAEEDRDFIVEVY